jgi:hypothetical protein
MLGAQRSWEGTTCYVRRAVVVEVAVAVAVAVAADEAGVVAGKAGVDRMAEED